MGNSSRALTSRSSTLPDARRLVSQDRMVTFSAGALSTGRVTDVVTTSDSFSILAFMVPALLPGFANFAVDKGPATILVFSRDYSLFTACSHTQGIVRSGANDPTFLDASLGATLSVPATRRVVSRPAWKVFGCSGGP